jgi:hypothetical protein
MEIEIPIKIDKSAKDTKLFEKMKTVKISKKEIFKYGVLIWEVKNRILESDFNHLQSLIPAFEQLYSENIEFSEHGIKNTSNDDRVKKLTSELIGVGVGIKYSNDLIGYNLNTLNKIPPAVEGKYLDYSFVMDKNLYEIETKGTVSVYSTSMIKDIVEKKRNKREIFLRFGTIAHILDDKEESKSELLIVDDPPSNNNKKKNLDSIEFINNYLSYLAFIVDNTQYNKLIRQIKSNKINKIRIKKGKFFGTYSLNNQDYVGEYFDRRLVIKNIEKSFSKLNDSISKRILKSFFKEYTAKIGKHKFFIGIDRRIVDLINDGDFDKLGNFSVHKFLEEHENKYRFLDSDGVLVVKSVNGSDTQIENMFNENEVEKRLGLYLNYLNGQQHECGADCRSRNKIGQSCQILTYRKYCHFHR